VWLNAERVSPYDYWQFWRNTEDAMSAASSACSRNSRWPRSRGSPRCAAPRSTTRRRRWRPRPAPAARPRRGRGRRRDSAPHLRGGRSGRDAAEPCRGASAGIVDLLAEAKLVASKGEARRLIAQTGVRLNDTPVAEATASVTEADLRDGAAKLSLGRKRHLLVHAAG
jgi:tyrosyl-tRNA synthetase